MEATRQEHGQNLNITEHDSEKKRLPDKVHIVSHSMLYYWWPVWVIGFLMAGITWFFGEDVSVTGGAVEKIYSSTNMGLIYTLVLFAVLMITNITLRGVISAVVVFGVMFVAVLFAWLGWWDEIISLVPHLTIHMNFGFYILLSTLVFILWTLNFFVFDRLSYWRVEAGQITHEKLIGGGEESYDTSGLVFSEKHDDPFRHWMLGFGAGDLTMYIKGAKSKEVNLPNVLFANHKVTQAQDLIKRKPD